MTPLPIKIFLNEQQRRCILVVDTACVWLNEEQLTESVKKLLENIRIATQRSFTFLSCVSLWDFKKILEGKVSHREMTLKLEAFLEAAKKERVSSEESETATVSPSEEVLETAASSSVKSRRKITRRADTTKAASTEEKAVSPKSTDRVLKEARKRASIVSSVNFSSKGKDEQLHCLERVITFMANYLRQRHPQLMNATSEIAIAIEETASFVGHLRSRLRLSQQEEKASSFQEAYHRALSLEVSLPQSFATEPTIEVSPKKSYLSIEEGQRLSHSLQSSSASSFWKINKPWRKGIYSAELFPQSSQSFFVLPSSSAQEVIRKEEKTDVEAIVLPSRPTQDKTIPRPVAPVEMEQPSLEGLFSGSDDEEEMELTESLAPVVEAIQPRATKKRKAVSISKGDEQPSTSDSTKDVEEPFIKKSKISSEAMLEMDEQVLLVKEKPLKCPKLMISEDNFFVLQTVFVMDVFAYIQEELHRINILLKQREIRTNTTLELPLQKMTECSLQTLRLHLKLLLSMSQKFLKEKENIFVMNESKGLFLLLTDRLTKIASSMKRSSTMSEFSDKNSSTKALEKEKVPFLGRGENCISINIGLCSDIVHFTPRKKMLIFKEMIQFLSQVRRAVEKKEYVCYHHIPELEMAKGTQEALWKGLYACVLRNQYFYSKDTGVLPPAVVTEIYKVLNHLNKRYCGMSVEEAEKTEDISLSSHHPELRALTIDPANPPQPIFIGSVFSVIYIEKRKKEGEDIYSIKEKKYVAGKSTYSQCTHIHVGIRDTQDRYREIKENFAVIKMKSKHPSFSLGQSLKGYATVVDMDQRKVVNILLQMEEINYRNYQNYFRGQEDNPEVKKAENIREKISQLYVELLTYLKSWREELEESMIEEDVEEASVSTKDIVMGDIESSKQSDELSKQFPMIISNRTGSGFAIDYYTTPISLRIFKSLLSKASKLKIASSYVAKEGIISEIPREGRAPNEIIIALVSVVCRFATLYYCERHRARTLITQDIRDQLSCTLTELNKEYHHVLNMPYSQHAQGYHKDIQAIVNQSQVAKLLAERSSYYCSFSLVSIKIDILKGILKVDHSVVQDARECLLWKKVEEIINRTCCNIIRLIKTPSRTHLWVGTMEGSGLVPGATMSQKELLPYFKNTLTVIFNKLKQDKYQVMRIDSRPCDRAFASLQVTLAWLEAAINGEALPSEPLPDHLNPLILSFISLKRYGKKYFIRRTESAYYGENRELRTITSKMKILRSIVITMFNEGLEADTFIYENGTTSDLVTAFAFVYRAMEKMLLQMVTTYTFLLERRKTNEETIGQRIINESRRSIEEMMQLIMDKRRELLPDQEMPEVTDLSPELRACLSWDESAVMPLELQEESSDEE